MTHTIIMGQAIFSAYMAGSYHLEKITRKDSSLTCCECLEKITSLNVGNVLN